MRALFLVLSLLAGLSSAAMARPSVDHGGVHANYGGGGGPG